jgi:HTH-type transcriptional regulator, competence development regulator
MNEGLGELLRKARKEKGLTLRAVEQKTGISNAYLSQLENMKISSPSPTILRKLADSYEISYSQLLELTGYPTEEPNKNRLLFRTSKRLEEISPEEEKELLTYLRFLRMKGREP